MLHPRHKLEYFRKQKWEEEWINTAEQILTTEYERSYKKYNDDEGDGSGDEDGVMDLDDIDDDTVRYLFEYYSLKIG